MTEKETLLYYIYKHLVTIGAKDLAIILNGRYVTQAGKLVYITIDDDKDKQKLRCYYKAPGESQRWDKVDVSDQVLQTIYLQLSSSSLFEFKLPIDSIPCSSSLISSNASLGFLILESYLYKLGKNMMSKDTVGISTTIEGYKLDNTTLNELKTVFRRNSFSIYQDTIYNKVQNRIIQKIYRRNKFYNIQKMFIPLFIQVNGLYNPFFDDVQQHHMFEQTNLYKMCIDKNRILEVGDDIKCYMLTQLEVCQAMGLTKYMRFTPDFIYKVYIGLIHPDYSEFPNKISKVFIPTVNMEDLSGLKRKYYPSELQEEILKFDIRSKDMTLSEDERRRAEKMAKALMQYIEIDTLRYACIKNRKALTTIGPSVLDGSVSERDLYNIIFEARV